MGISMKKTSGKILASAALLGTAAAVAGLGTFGEFNDSTSAETVVSAGTIDMDLGGLPGTSVMKLNDMLPGDEVQQLFTLTNNGTSNFGRVTLSTKSSTAEKVIDLAGQLDVTIERCAENPTTKLDSTCGTWESVVDTYTVGTDKDLSGLAAMQSTKSDLLRVTAALPVDTSNAYQDEKSTIEITLTATQPLNEE